MTFLFWTLTRSILVQVSKANIVWNGDSKTSAVTSICSFYCSICNNINIPTGYEHCGGGLKREHAMEAEQGILSYVLKTLTSKMLWLIGWVQQPGWRLPRPGVEIRPSLWKPQPAHRMIAYLPFSEFWLACLPEFHNNVTMAACWLVNSRSPTPVTITKTVTLTLTSEGRERQVGFT